jgi:hypothetical protein
MFLENCRDTTDTTPTSIQMHGRPKLIDFGHGRTNSCENQMLNFTCVGKLLVEICPSPTP